jgi:hypothetical protein
VDFQQQPAARSVQIAKAAEDNFVQMLFASKPAQVVHVLSVVEKLMTCAQIAFPANFNSSASQTKRLQTQQAISEEVCCTLSLLECVSVQLAQILKCSFR